MNNFWKNKRVLITGHEGFLGANLAITLIGAGAKVIGIDKVKNRPISVLNGFRDCIKSYKLDITDYKRLQSVIFRERPDIVFHLAAEAIVGRAKKQPLNVFKSNIEGTWNLLEISRVYGKIKSIVVASSDKAYGPAKMLPYTEETPLFGRHPYDASKSCADIIAQSYFHSYRMPIGVLRCGNIYGPGDFNFSRLVPDAIRSILNSRRLMIRSD